MRKKYGPLEFVSPVAIQLKILFQMIYQDKPPSDQVFEGNLKRFDVKFLNDSKLL